MLDPVSFLRKLFAALAEHEVDVSRLPLDHLCYRVESAEQYQALRTDLDMKAVLLGEHQIGGRLIATYRLLNPFHFEGRNIDVLELPAPKPGSPYPAGFEHAEFVANEGLMEFTLRYPRLAWDQSGMDKTINGDVRLRFDGFSVKFHRRALADVIADEKV